ncbi:MAG: TfoX/Sxy family protein [Candidatus Limnocylindria bacterium]
MDVNQSGGWKKAPAELVTSFSAAIAAIPALERRPMFGYPAAFANGNLVTGLFEDRWMVRLPDDAIAELTELGGLPFEPMPGRPMRGYLAFPPQMVANPDVVAPWLQRALAHVLQMPPKTKAKR